jgi:hypothetical protein
MRLLLLLLAIIVIQATHAQETTVSTQDSLIVESRDTVLLKTQADPKRYDPRKALLYAAILPGLGQIYNKKYWKLPLVYGGLYATGYAINVSGDLYTDYRSMVFRAIEKGVQENEVDPDLNMRTTLRGYRIAVDKARRERDYFIIIMGVVYLLQIVDAHVDSHLKEFDLNPKLQVSIEPMVEQNSLVGRQTGASIIIRF